MRYLTKFQYLSYRKVSLLYIVFITFYFLTGSVDALRHFRQLNEIVYDRLEKETNLNDWRDSVQANLALERAEILISSRDPIYELNRYEPDLSVALNNTWKSQESSQASSIQQAAMNVYGKAQLPNETPNVVVSTLIGMESLRKLRKIPEEGIASDEESLEAIFGQLRIQVKSVFVQGEFIEVKWPNKAPHELWITFDNEKVDTIAPGGSYKRKLTKAGKFEIGFQDAIDSYKKTIEVLSQGTYRFAFGQRYYHINSGVEYLISLHNQGYSSGRTIVKSSSESARVKWIDNESIVFQSSPVFSGVINLYFMEGDAVRDSLRLRVTPKGDYQLQLLKVDGTPTAKIQEATRLRILVGADELPVLSGALVLYFADNQTRKLEVERGRFTDFKIDIPNASLEGMVLNDALIVDQQRNRLALDRPIIYWLN